MLGSNMLEVGIGIILVYLILSLAVTSAKEGIATMLRHRAKFLEDGIETLLNASQDDVAKNPQSKLHWLCNGPDTTNKGDLTNEFINEPLITSLLRHGKTPPYIPAWTFAAALIQLIRKQTGEPLNATVGFQDIRVAVSKLEATHPQLEGVLTSLLDRAQTDIASPDAALSKFETQIQCWFNHAMDGVSGMFKRHTQAICFCIAATFVIALNVDTIDICRQLSKEATLRAALTDAAKPILAQGAPKPTSGNSDLKDSVGQVINDMNKLQNLGLPLGWALPADLNKASAGTTWAEFLISKALGLLITALAATLGAPFWFDVLNKFMSIRGVGKSPDEVPKSHKKP